MSSDKVSEALHKLRVQVELVDGVHQIRTKQGKDWHLVATAKKYKDMLSELKQLGSKK